MRVLLVDGYPSSSKRGRERFSNFRQHVIKIIGQLEKQEVTHIEIVEKHRSELDDFLFEMHSEFADPLMITNFDRLDFVFVDGDANHALPWSPAMRKLALLTKMCMMTGKCFFGSGIGANFVAFVCSTAGEYYRILNNGGKGSLIDDIHAIPAPTTSSHSNTPFPNKNEVVLDTKTGDFFTFDSEESMWVPTGNTGFVLHSSDRAKDYGARPNSARAGIKYTRVSLSQPLCLAKRGETKCCWRLECIHHELFTNFMQREVVVNCQSQWDLDEEIVSTGNNKYKVLMDSARGPMLIEFGNCIGTHFGVVKEYPETLQLLTNFVVTKYELLKIHAHIDRSYVSAISGSARLKDRLNLAQTKTIGLPKHQTRQRSSVSSNSSNNNVNNQPPMMMAGRTSPKRIRPVSAGPQRSASKVTVPIRTINTSRSAYPSATIRPKEAADIGVSHWEGIDTDNNVAANRSHRSTSGSRSAKELHPETLEHSSVACNQATEHQMSNVRAQPPQRRVRVPQKNELEKPYCGIHKFNRMKEAEQSNGRKTSYYSVVNDAPYVSASERETLENQKNKLKWVAGPFRTVFGKATTHIVPEAGIFASDPFVQENVPFFIIQRRELERQISQSDHNNIRYGRLRPKLNKKNKAISP